MSKTKPFGAGRCPNCEEYGAHFVPPSLGEEGFFICKKKVKSERKEFKGNVLVTVSEQEVRVWVCNEKGENIFRFKALGKVYKGDSDITMIGKL